jgi:hypothetical protein
MGRERLAELAELRAFFEVLVREVDRFISRNQSESILATAASRAGGAPFFSPVSGRFRAGVMDFHVRNYGKPVGSLGFETAALGAHVCEWYLASLPTNEIFRAVVDLEYPEPHECAFLLRIRDRGGS